MSLDKTATVVWDEMLRSEVKLPTDSGLSEKMNAAYLSFKNASTEDKDKMTHIDKLIGHLR